MVHFSSSDICFLIEEVGFTDTGGPQIVLGEKLVLVILFWLVVNLNFLAFDIVSRFLLNFVAMCNKFIAILVSIVTVL